jgi:diguanylate cyclase
MKLGFRSRLLLAAALPAVMVILLLVIGFLDRHAADLELALEDRGRATAKQLAMSAEFPLFAGNVEALDRLVQAVGQGDPLVRAAAVSETSGELRAATGEFTAWTKSFNGAEQVIKGDSLMIIVPIHRSALPLPDDLFADPMTTRSAAHEQLLGYAVVQLSRDTLVQQNREMLVRILAITAGGLLLAALLSTTIAGSVTRPLAHISQVVTRIKGGELNARALTEDAGVMEPLAAGINAMAARIAYTQEDLRQQVASATAELRQQKEAAEQAARVDTLTGVASRRAFTEVAEVEVQRALRYGTALSLVLIDLDHFKDVNDHYGHQTGDAVLASFARTLIEAVREVDLVGRWGGEEFVVLLPGTTAAEALQVADRMRASTADSRLYFQGRQILYTASFGVAEFNPRELSFYGLLARADAALYGAKNRGRNCVELATNALKRQTGDEDTNAAADRAGEQSPASDPPD